MFQKGSFLSDILSLTNQIKSKKNNEQEFEKVENKVIWNNSYIRIANKPYFYQSYRDQSFLFIYRSC